MIFFFYYCHLNVQVFIFLMGLSPLQSFFMTLQVISSLVSDPLFIWLLCPSDMIPVFLYSFFSFRSWESYQADYFCPRAILPQPFIQAVLFQWELIFRDHNLDVWDIHYYGFSLFLGIFGGQN